MEREKRGYRWMKRGHSAAARLSPGVESPEPGRSGPQQGDGLGPASTGEELDGQRLSPPSTCGSLNSLSEGGFRFYRKPTKRSYDLSV